MQKNQYKGLSTEEVNSSRKLNGRNISKKFRRNTSLILLEVFKEPMLLLLLVVSTIYFITGAYHEGIIMLCAVALVAAISIFQQIRSEQAVNALAKLSQSSVKVIRNDVEISIDSEELVTGDIIVISEGEQLPADASIIQQNDLTVNESILTGESFAVAKEQENNMLFSGTTIASGSAIAEVKHISNSTRIGKLGILIQATKKEKTPLEQQVNVFVNRMALLGFLAFTFVCIYNYYESYSWLHALMHGLTIAMAVLPEEIPVALSSFMALGAYHMLRNNVLVKQPQTVEALGAATVICVDKTGTITENKMAVVEIYDYSENKIFNHSSGFHSSSGKQLLLTATLASEIVPFDPMEKAIHEAFEKTGIERGQFKMIKEYPLSGIHPMMTHIYQDDAGKIIATCKGAPEGIISHSNLNKEEQLRIIQLLRQMAAKGNRVLTIASIDMSVNTFPEDQFSIEWNFLGLLSLNDPPKKNIADVIKSFYNAGIDVKMITGDFPETASSIAKLIQLRNPDEVITGAEMEGMSDEALQNIVSRIHVFARTQPEMKLRIINALKGNKEVVAMTGDGVNDAPALKAAHIGIAMGKKGSEAARQAASLVLVNDDLLSMVTAVAYGRKIYANLKKAIQYIISIHIPLISIVTVPLVLGWTYPNIFFPIHIIFLELVMGPTCSIAYENEPMDKNLLTQKPRKFTDNFFTWGELSLSILQGIIIASGLLGVHYYAIQSNLSETITRTMLFTTLVFSNILLTLTGRSKSQTALKTIGYNNYLIPLVIFITLGLLIMSLYYQPVQQLFHFATISSQQILICIATAALSVLWVDLYKLTGIKKNS